MLRIRLARIGNKNRPFYKIVVTNVCSSRDGKYIEKLGVFDSIYKKKINISINRIFYWISKGATISKRVFYIIKNKKRGNFENIKTYNIR